jgi:ADP-ribose pyrophosphatase
MEYFEKCIDRDDKYHGIIVDVHVDSVELDDGSHAKREVVEHPGGVTILPVDQQGNCYMVRQFRYPAGRMMLEAPAGKLEYGEEPKACAIRELSEETGFTADEFIDLGSFFTSPGFSSEKLYIYLALGLHEGQSHLDQGEFLNVEKHTLREIRGLIMANEIEDAKTIIAVLKAEKLLKFGR